jgi:hypothetical protein
MRTIAHFFSVVFHPLFLPVYGLIIIIQANPSIFQFIDRDPRLMIAIIVVNTIILPLVTILIMKGLGFVKSIQLKDRSERIAPFIAGLFYMIWTVVVFYRQGDTPFMVMVLLMGALVALILVFMGTILMMKVSVHAAAMGVSIGYLIAMAPLSEKNIIPFVIAAILIGGMVGTSRLILKAHTEDEVYMGFLLGLASQLGAFYFMT